MVDQSMYSVRLTLWGNQAAVYDGTEEHPVLSFRGLRLGDFNGRSLSALSSTSMMRNPDIPEAHRLRGWYDSQGQYATFTAYSKNNVGADLAYETANGKKEVLKTLAEVEQQNLGMSDKKDYFSAEVMIIYFKTDNAWYAACPNEGCNKKVVEDGSSWRCEKCDQNFPQPDYRWVLSLNASDHTSNMWMTCFNEIGTQLLGKTAGEMHELKVKPYIVFEC